MKKALASLMLLLSIASVAFAQITPSISVSGRLTAAGTGLPISGDREITFAIYDAADNSLFTVTKTVTVSEGLFSTTIEPSLPFNQDYFLQLGVDGETLNPKQKITPAPYAIYANRAGELGSGVLTISGNSITSAGDIAAGGKITTGNIAIGTSPNVIASTSGVLTLATSGDSIFFDTGNDGTTEVIIKPDGKVGIGAEPQAKLDVTGDARISTLEVTGNLKVGDNKLFVDSSSGNVGIGTAGTSSRLAVDGTIESTSLKIGEDPAARKTIRYVAGTDVQCPSGSSVLLKNFVARTCTSTRGCGSCTTAVVWSTNPPTCTIADRVTFSQTCGVTITTCTATSWTEALCIGS
jgi:hypothetical protein